MKINFAVIDLILHSTLVSNSMDQNWVGYLQQTEIKDVGELIVLDELDQHNIDTAVRQ